MERGAVAVLGKRQAAVVSWSSRLLRGSGRMMRKFSWRDDHPFDSFLDEWSSSLLLRSLYIGTRSDIGSRRIVARMS